MEALAPVGVARHQLAAPLIPLPTPGILLIVDCFLGSKFKRGYPVAGRQKATIPPEEVCVREYVSY